VSGASDQIRTIPVVSVPGFLFTFPSVFKINFYDQQITVTTREEKGKTIYVLEWPDHSMDYLYKEDGNWKSITMNPPSKTRALGSLIESVLQ
jgi:hypothetical protein